MSDNKTIDVVIVNFEKPEQDLPALAELEGDATCKSTAEFYNALKEKGLTDAVVEDYTLIQYERPEHQFLQVRNACCVGDFCKTTLDRGDITYCELGIKAVKGKLDLENAAKNHFLLIVEEEAAKEQLVKCVLQNLDKEGYQLNYTLAQLPSGE